VNPSATQKIRRSTALLAVLWASSALVLAIHGQITSRSTVSPPIQTSALGGVALINWCNEAAIQSGVEVGDRVLEVNGVPVRQWYRDRGWEALRVDVPIRYQIETAEGKRFTVELYAAGQQGSAYDLFLLPIMIALIVVGSAYLFLGVFVWRLKPDRAESWAFLLFAAAIATQLFGSFHTYDSLWGFERMLVNLPFVGAAAFHLFTTFPFEPAWVVRHPWVRIVPYPIAGLIALVAVVDRAMGTPHGAVPIFAYAFAFGGALTSVLILLRERIRLHGSADVSSADIVLLGALVSFVPVLLMLATQVFFRRVTFPLWLALLWFAVFPIAVAYGIVRSQFFDIRGLARSSATYGAVTLLITGIFASLITFADAAFARFNVEASSPYFSVTFLFFAILAFNPLRNRLQSLVDRVFDRDRAGYRTAVREISEAMVAMLSLNEISERLLAAVTDTMGVDRAMVLLLSEDERVLRPIACRGDWDDEDRDFSLSVDHPIGKHLWMRRHELARGDFDDATDAETRDACRDIFDTLEVKLLVPILFGVDLLGVIAVGGKLSGDQLGADDRQLLRTLANQSAIAIENAQAFDEIAKLNETLEARVEERTGELKNAQAQLMQSEKMRSLGQLVAGVAHELNNPIGFVHANLQLLDDYIGRLMRLEEDDPEAHRLRDTIAKLLARSREGTERVKKIVLDLRTFSRMDQAELSEADLNEEIQRTLSLMEPRFKDEVRVERDFQPLPLVKCLPAQLNQVFMNLVLNSCDALGGKGSIRIRTRPVSEGVLLEFEDDGPGIPEALRSRIFDPFFTTKPVGQGTGLGLSISHGIVERHGGQMKVVCPRRGGTIFRITLPLVTPSEGDVA
jgi:signal transduction histidine kinase